MTEKAVVERILLEQDPAADTARLQQQVQQLQQEVQQLHYALEHRPETDRVVGMIMLVASCDAEAAWAVLARVSQNTNRKVRDVAALISAQVSTGYGLPPDLAEALTAVLPSRAAAVRQLTRSS